MTPAQQAALETVARRALDAAEASALAALLAAGDFAGMAAHDAFAGRIRLGLVNRADFAGWAASYGMRSKIEDAASTVGHPLRDSALAILDVLRGAADGIDLGKPANQAMLDAWVQGGALLAADRDVLRALATRSDPAPWPEIVAALEAVL